MTDMIPPTRKWPALAKETKSAVVWNGLGHMTMYKRFAKTFARDLDDFWGRTYPAIDGEVRRQPDNVSGFDVQAFIKAFALRVSPTQPAKSLRKALLARVRAKWGDEGVQVIGRLLGAPTSFRQHSKKAGTDSK